MVFHTLSVIKIPTITAGENGALAPPMDRPEQALNILREAIAGAGHADGSDISVALRCSTADIYDKVSMRTSPVQKICAVVLHYTSGNVLRFIDMNM